MIDEKKYEGHTPAEHWALSLWGFSMPTGFDADAQLIADAPDLLAEVKRLTAMLNIAEQNIPRSIHWDCYWEALIEAGLEKEDDEG